MSLEPDRTPSANNTYPRITVSLSPDLGETHPRTLDQIRALDAINGYRLDPTYAGPAVVRFARVICAPQRHAAEGTATIAAVWKIGSEFVYAASVPESHAAVRALEKRPADFKAVAHDQWIWGPSWPEVDRLLAYCPRHHGTQLWIDRALLLEELEAISLGPRHAQRSYIQLTRVASIVN